ncbi:Retrotransposon gag domain [Sesbania bispinosa]|nr:Retrotransposon gag domain [Sesbania bispinosa]
MVISWITKSISTNIAQSVVYIDNAQELWDDLKETFYKGDHFRTFDLLQELQSIKQGDRSISDYFMKEIELEKEVPHRVQLKNEVPITTK